MLPYRLFVYLSNTGPAATAVGVQTSKSSRRGSVFAAKGDVVHRRSKSCHASHGVSKSITPMHVQHRMN